MRKTCILLIEDEADLAELIAMRLRREQYDVEAFQDGQAGLKGALAQPPDLILLDIMLPGMSGTDVLIELRKDPQTAHVPVIMLTARGEDCDIITNLTLGADDYITKPFSAAVLVARISAVLRRARQQATRGDRDVLTAGPITVDRASHRVEIAGRNVELTLTEFQLLTSIISAGGRVLTRDRLIDEVRGKDSIVTDRTIDVHVASLRRKLGRARRYIETVRGVGYRLAAVANH